MARYPLVLPDALMADLKDYCAKHDAVLSRKLVRWVQEGFDRERAAPLAPPAAPAPMSALPPVAGAAKLYLNDSDMAKTVQRGDTIWFDLDHVCTALQVARESLLQEIDPDDDVIQYAGTEWIDERGIKEARALCPDPQLADQFWSWAERKINSTSTKEPA